MPDEKQDGLKLSFFLNNNNHMIVEIRKWFFGAWAHESAIA
ncbi:MAG: hypothetical protein N0E38_16015 [Candidatus Thiodiazotropha endolucinida]|nr:hypothetical protein [Candidatus Thiodiazotropha endolucinida]